MHLRINKRIWDDLQRQIFLGVDGFVEKHQLNFELLELGVSEIPFQQRTIATLTLDEYQSKYPDKHPAIYNTYKSAHFTKKQIGKYFGLLI